MKAKLFFLNVMLSLLVTLVPLSKASRSEAPVQVRSEIANQILPASQDTDAGETNQPGNSPAVSLQAVSGKTVEFWTQNGRTVGGVSPQRKDIPRLVLFRNGQLTEARERSLKISVTGLNIPAQGAQASLKIETQASDPDIASGNKGSFTVWQASQELPATPPGEQPGPLKFKIEIPGTITVAGSAVHTPTDYLRYEITVADNGQPDGEPLYHVVEEYAFLLESQWIEPLPPVLEATPGAAPEALVLYYLDMTPFQTSAYDPQTRLPRAEITGYIQNDLVPAMVTAYQQESLGWGFPWYPAWTGYRSGEDAERLTVALSDGRTWYYGLAPSIGYGEISLKVSAGYGEQASYASLTEKLLGPFYHELFHNHQRNLSLQLSGSGDVDGKDNAWTFFSEGTAVLASSVGQPGLQLGSASGTRDYLFNANSFIADDLNRSYAGMNAYHAALYWRYLYEQCGGLQDGKENPSTGMKVVRNALETLYSGEEVDIQESTDLVAALPKVLDRAISATPACPFRTYRDSLEAFSRAIYSLRLESEISGPGIDDTKAEYRAPEAIEVAYSGGETNFSGNIPASFGMDFVEVQVAAGKVGPLTIEFAAGSEPTARFHAELWTPLGSKESVTLSGGPVEVRVDGATRLGLLITRLDSAEATDPAGEYSIKVQPVLAGN